MIKKIFTFIFFTFIFLIFLSYVNNFGDIFRHLKSGEMFFSGDWHLARKMFYENFYSYTQTNYFFVNHHWLASVFFYLIFIGFGFIGLSFFYAFLNFIGFLIVFFISEKEGGFSLSVWLSFLVSPILASRPDIRPEFFTYIFSPMIFFMLWYYRNRKLRSFWLWFIPLILIFWVNINIYFIFVIYWLGIFIFEAFIEKIIYPKPDSNEQIKHFFMILLASLFALCLNPWGGFALIYPFLIHSQIQLPIVESESVLFWEQRSLFYVYFSIFFLIRLTYFFFVWKKYHKIEAGFFLWINTLIFLCAWQSRNSVFFGLFFIPMMAAMMGKLFVYLKKLFSSNEKVIKILIDKATWSFVAVIFAGAFLFWQKEGFVFSLGWGLKKESKENLKILEKFHPQGKIFNNFNASSFMIFALYPEYSVAIDQRPEAYGEYFWKEIFSKMMTEEKAWENWSKIYKIKGIVFSKFGEQEGQFLMRRIKSGEWRKIYWKNELVILEKVD